MSEPRDDGPQSLGHLLRDRAARAPDRLLFRDASGASLTVGAVDRWSDATACRFVAEGIGAGDRVAILMANGVAWPVAWWSLAKLGAIAVPLNPMGGPHDLGHVLRHSGACAVVADRDATLPDGLEVPRRLTLAPQPHGPIASPPSVDGVERAALVGIQYTSGTTGLPKGVMLSHDYWLRLGAIARDFADLGEDDVVLTVQPFYYVDPQWAAVMCLVAGAQLVIEPRFSATRFWPAVVEHGVTFVYLIGTMPQMLHKQPEDPALDRAHRLRGVACSGIPPALHADFERRWGVPFREAYGMTETGVDLIMGFEDHDSVGSGAVGRPIAGKEVRVVDAEGHEVPDGTVGELVVRGRPRMEGYWGDPVATRQTFRDGWLHTGDLAIRDRDGAFRLVGRIKDMIRRGGENIAAAEVEDVLCQHPDVLAAAVVAVPDAIRGEEVMAFLQPRVRRIPEPEVVTHVLQRLAPYKAPRYIKWVTEFPLTPSERIAKHLLVGPSEDPIAGAWDARA